MLKPQLWPVAALTVMRTWGLWAAGSRALFEARRSANQLRSVPKHTTIAHDHGRLLFIVDADRLCRPTNEKVALERADRVVNGSHQAYRWEWRALPANPQEWVKHTPAVSEATQPWWTVEHLDPSGADIKDVWEPARFGWVYDLVRGHLMTGDPKYAAAFARYFRSWFESSPPFYGVHWACGQESSIRAVALLFAESNFGPELLARLGVLDDLRATLAATGERVADAIGYAISQRNNHGVSEATGLTVLGVRLRGAHPDADSWLRRGKKLLDRLVVEQFEEDGWYIQHSFSYLRVAMEQCIVAQHALASIGESLSNPAIDRLKAATRLVATLIDAETGLLPNHGGIDGAFVLPITTRGYRDYRPLLTSAAATWNEPVPDGVPLDPEPLAWLGAEAPSVAKGRAEGVIRGTSGWAAARVGETFVFIRAGNYRSRPGHIDPLHLEVRFAGREVIVDPGTFAYNHPAPWRNGLTGAFVHNGPVVDGEDPGIRGPRFLWYRWPHARITRADFDGNTAAIVAELDNRARRTVVVAADAVSVQDECIDLSASKMEVVWLLHPSVDSAFVQVDAAAKIGSGEEGTTIGWFSPHYGERVRTTYVRATTNNRHITTRIALSADGLVGPASTKEDEVIETTSSAS